MIKRLGLGLSLVALCWSCGARAESWEERMWRQVNKKVAFEFVDVKLSEACDFMSSLTGLNIILAPAVRQKDPVFTLRVQDMDAGTALKWFTELTDTYAELVDQAIYITDTPNEKLVDEEKDELMKLGARYGIVVELPPGGMPLTGQDVIKVALQIMEKEALKIQDFPGPDVSLGTAGVTGMALGK